MLTFRHSDGSAVAFLRVPFFTPVLLTIILAMLAEAMAVSYMAILAVDKIGMAPLELGSFIAVSAISGIIGTTIFGHLHDRTRVTWPLIVSLLAKIVAFAICAVATETWMLLLNGALLFGVSSASFALLSAMAKSYLDGSDEQTAARGMAALRMGNSFSWAVGPAIGVGLVAYWRLDTIYLGAAILAGLALTVVLLSRIRVVPIPSNRQLLTPKVFFSAAPAVGALVAFHAAMFTGSNAMTIVVAQQLGSEVDVGILTSVCAILEVFVMGLFVIRPVRRAEKRWLAIGFLFFAMCFVLPALWPTLPSIYVAQIPRAIGIAIISIVGLAHLQGFLPGRPGMASALFGNSGSVGLLFSAISTGICGQLFGYMSLFSLCVGLCVIGASLAIVGKPQG
ncbi:SET family sugar efflux transporter-like MFS transporter [Devosia sp. UYZn731]|uniref:MFS transporter n=1 Tax=Devosia sp. UYZn731 TaxID=3156345 RepID=UPI0033978B49